MPKEDSIEVEGKIIETLPNAMFREDEDAFHKDFAGRQGNC
jgi:translation initiation factor IF-1